MGTGLRPVTPRYYKPLNPHPVEPDGDFLKHTPLLGGVKTGKINVNNKYTLCRVTNANPRLH